MDSITFIENLYDTHTGLCNSAILILVFFGMARIAFWREHDGLHVGGPTCRGPCHASYRCTPEMGTR